MSHEQQERAAGGHAPARLHRQRVASAALTPACWPGDARDQTLESNAPTKLTTAWQVHDSWVKSSAPPEHQTLALQRGQALACAGLCQAQLQCTCLLAWRCQGLDTGEHCTHQAHHGLAGAWLSWVKSWAPPEHQTLVLQPWPAAPSSNCSAEHQCICLLAWRCSK